MFNKQLGKLAAIFLLGLLATVFLQPGTSVSAAPEGLNFTVNDTADLTDKHPGDGQCASKHNTCTLRAAIMESNAHPGTDVIHLQANTTYTLTRVGNDDKAKKGDLDVTESIQLLGNGATIDANGAVTHDRALQFLQVIPTYYYSVLKDVTITGGNTPASGGGIWNQSFVVLDHATVKSNHADTQGGGIANDGFTTLEYSTVAENDCTCADEQHPGGGGLVNHEIFALFASTVNNNVSHFDGGGIWTDGSQLIVIASTFAWNNADRNGGAFYNKGTESIITHSTIASNAADDDHNDTGFGGGIYNEPGGTVTLGHTILAKNANIANYLWSWDDCHGALDSTGHNIIYYNNLCVVSAIDNLMGFDPGLDTFGDHGGPTQTYALQGGGWAIDNGDPNGCKAGDPFTLPFDQRLDQRVVDGSGDNVAVCDIGAFEYNSTPFAIACNGKPNVPMLGLPQDQKKVKGPQIFMDFSAGCADTFKLVVRQSSKHGPKVDQVSELAYGDYLTTQLQKGQTYYWRVTACNGAGCAKSVWQSFTVK